MITAKKNLIDVTMLSSSRCSASILVDLKYATSDNFTGKVVEGYTPDATNIGLLAKKATLGLCEAQEYLFFNYGCTLLIYDAYRPLRAVNYFSQWCEAPDNDSEYKKHYYPHVDKSELIELGYLSNKSSSHCCGNAVDLVLADRDTHEPLDMGSIYNYFDPISQNKADIKTIGVDACRYRHILSSTMQRFGFRANDEMYWHFEWSEQG